MEKVYRYRMVFDERFSAIPFDDWGYISYHKYCEIKESIDKGSKYQLQVLLVTHHHEHERLTGEIL